MLTLGAGPRPDRFIPARQIYARVGNLCFAYLAAEIGGAEGGNIGDRKVYAGDERVFTDLRVELLKKPIHAGATAFDKLWNLLDTRRPAW